MKDGPENEHEKVALRREKGALQYPKQNKQHWTRTEWKIATEKKREQQQKQHRD